MFASSCGRSVQLFNLNSIHFGSLSIGTCTALGNCKGGDSGKKEKDDEGGKEAVFAESHPEPVLKSKCFLMKNALIMLVGPIFVIFRHASVSSTYPCQSVSWSVSDTFELLESKGN